MSTKRAALSTLFLLMLAGCTSASPAVTSAPMPTEAPVANAPTSSPTLAPTPVAIPSTAATPIAVTTTAPTPDATAGACVPEGDGVLVAVSGRANIFGAGHAEAPDPGSGGGGRLPELVPLDISGGSEVTFPCTTGIVDCCNGTPNSDPSGPEGSDSWHTSIESFGGISGVIHENRGIFIAGVFLGDEEPADPAPERLDFTELCPTECTFDQFEPEIGQLFYIGPGGADHVYVAPEGATRLFLGVPDGFYSAGPPGWYSNNSGEYQAVVDVQ
jgi:hypothetical protein